MSEDWSEKWYKEAFARSSAGKPKAEVWKHIESSLGSWFKRWYQSGAAGQSKQPKAQVWEALSAYVDQELLLRRQLRLRLLRGFGFAFLFAVLPLSLADQFSQNSTHPDALSSAQTTAVAESEIFLAQPAGSYMLPAMVEQMEPTVAQRAEQAIPAPPAQPLAALHQEYNSTASTPEEDVNTLPSNALTEINTQLPSLGLAATELADRPFALPKWIVGASALYQHSNLYNETTRMGFASTSHISNESKPNFSMNLSLMRIISRRSAVSVGLRINDVKGQSYHDFEGSEYLIKSLICTYQSLSLNYHRLLQRRDPNARMKLELSTGLYGSYRTSISEFVGLKERHFLSPGIRKYDFGVQFGVLGAYRIFEPVDLTMGAYYTNGLMNIFKGVDKVPASFYTSFTASYGLSLGLRYQLK